MIVPEGVMKKALSMTSRTFYYEGKEDLLVVCLHGSHLYGTFTEESDVDVRGVFFPRLGRVLIGDFPDAYRWEDETDKSDLVLWSIQHYYKILKKGDTNVIEVLFTYTHPQALLYVTDRWYNFIEIGKRLIRRPLRGFYGFALALSQRYDIKTLVYRSLLYVYEKIKSLPDDLTIERVVDLLRDIPDDMTNVIRVEKGTDGRLYLKIGKHMYLLQSRVEDLRRSLEVQISKRGERVLKLAHRGNDMDWRAVAHAVRVLLEGIELHRTGEITFPLQQSQTIKEIKEGKWKNSDVKELLQKLLDEFDTLELGNGSVLPEGETSDDEFVEFMYRWVSSRICY